MLEFKSENGRTFFMEEEDKACISVLASGYIITPNGDFISSSNDHGMSFGGFYYLLEGKNPIEEDKLHTMEAINKLGQLGYSLFLGTKRTTNNYQDMSLGFGVVYIPENITEDQKKYLKVLLETNCRRWNKEEKLLTIEYALITIEGKMHQISEDDFNNIINDNSKKYVKNNNKN